MISGQRGRVSPLPGAGLPLPPVSPWTEEGMAVGTVSSPQAQGFSLCCPRLTGVWGCRQLTGVAPNLSNFPEEETGLERIQVQWGTVLGTGSTGSATCSWVTLREAVPSLNFSFLMYRNGNNTSLTGLLCDGDSPYDVSSTMPGTQQVPPLSSDL